MLVVSYGGGTNSVSMLVEMRDRGIVPDAIIFADTGGEKPHTYAHIEYMQTWLRNAGFPPITVVRKVDLNGEVHTLEDNCLENNMLPSAAYGRTLCSHKFKIQPQEKWLNNCEQAKKVWKEGKKVVKMIGYDADEPHRTEKDYSDNKYEYWYPLCEWDMGREECIESILRAGIPLPGKSSCYFCPNSKVSEIRELNAQYPELMQRAIALEENANLTKLCGLGRRFRWSNVIATDEMFTYPEPEMPCACYDG